MPSLPTRRRPPSSSRTPSRTTVLPFSKSSALLASLLRSSKLLSQPNPPGARLPRISKRALQRIKRLQRQLCRQFLDLLTDHRVENRVLAVKWLDANVAWVKQLQREQTPSRRSLWVVSLVLPLLGACPIG